MARHPLAAVLSAPSLQPNTTLSTYLRPAALAPTPLTQTAGWESTQQRRLQGRSALQVADQKGIQEFGEHLRQRQTRLLEISQAQFEAQERLLTAGKAQEDREEAQRSIAERVEALREDLSLAQAQYQVSRALASSSNDTLLYPDEPEKVAAEVERLKAAKLRAEIKVDALTGVRRAKVLWAGGVPPRNPRVLYAASRDVLKVLCDQLADQVTLAETSAEEKREQSAQDREQEVRRRVAQRLEGIRSRDETFLLRLDQEESLSGILLAEELPTRRAAEEQPVSKPVEKLRQPQERAKKSVEIASEKKTKESMQSASELEAEVRAAVLDIAKRRGIRVSFSPRPGLPDRTAEFANWIKVSL